MKRGFTLIELSIVLVIIGLIIGGVLVGQDLINGAKMRAVVSEAEKVKTAVTTFRVKYNALPGDFDQASSFWPNCNAYGGSLSQCNGNNDKVITQVATPGIGYQYESFMTWRHMSLAGLMTSDFTGQKPPSAPFVGVAVPKGPVEGSGFHMAYYETGEQYLGVGDGLSGAPARHYIWLGSGASAHIDGAALSGANAYSIDYKIDDGRPIQGNIRSGRGRGFGNPNCFSNAAPMSNAVYLETQDDITCRIYFPLGL